MLRHPCKTCITRPVCKKSCEDYKKYDTAFENLLYGAGLLISLAVHIIIIYVLFKFAEYPKTGMLIYFGSYYLVMLGMVLKSENEFEADTKVEVAVVWGLLPLWLLAMVLIYISDKTNLDQYPKKYNPYYRKIERINHEKSEKEKTRSQNASAC